MPQDLAGARDLAARGQYHEFEKWALCLINAQPGDLGKKGADRGLDGNVYFGKTSRAMVSVKAGTNVSVQMIRDLRGVIEREKAEIGVFLTLAPPTRPMVTKAAAAGQVEEPGFAGVPRLRIVSVEEAMRLRDRRCTPGPPRRRLQARRARGGAGAPGKARAVRRVSSSARFPRVLAGFVRRQIRLRLPPGGSRASATAGQPRPDCCRRFCPTPFALRLGLRATGSRVRATGAPLMRSGVRLPVGAPYSG